MKISPHCPNIYQVCMGWAGKNMNSRNKNLNYIDYWQDSLVTFGIDYLLGQEKKLE